MHIARAKPTDAPVLTEIAFAAKRHWGYPERWIEIWRPQLAVTPEFLSTHETYAAFTENRIDGFYTLERQADELHLLHLWVQPPAMGRGIGRALFLHAIARAHALGFNDVQIQSDPHAEAFYQHMGARRIGTTVTEVDQQRRELPVLIYEIKR